MVGLAEPLLGRDAGRVGQCLVDADVAAVDILVGDERRNGIENRPHLLALAGGLLLGHLAFDRKTDLV